VSWKLLTFRAAHLKGMAEVWNEAFAGGPNFVHLTEADFRRRVTEQPSFDPANLLVALRDGRVAGFTHFGFRSNLWHHLRDRRLDPTEGQVYVLVAPPGECQTMERLLDTAIERLAQGGARRVLLGPSWVFGAQPFYNGIAGAYEIPGLDPSREELVRLAANQGFTEIARYGTPELDLSDAAQLSDLRLQMATLEERAREWGLRRRIASLGSVFLAERHAVLLSQGSWDVAMAAFGLWYEYQREYGRRLFGITSVQVAEEWRGKGLGKLVMLAAMETAAAAGAEALHLHVHEANRTAWRLYHEALGFQPKCAWVTLARRLG